MLKFAHIRGFRRVVGDVFFFLGVALTARTRLLPATTSLRHVTKALRRTSAPIMLMIVATIDSEFSFMNFIVLRF